MKEQKTGSVDRRVARTQKLLREALHSLIREKDYDTIVVKEILDRADVGRSAFYAHFRDKDELLASSIEEMLGVVPPTRDAKGAVAPEQILWFSLPIFEHIDRQRGAHGLKLGPRGRTILHQRLQGILVNAVTKEFRRCFPAGKENPIPNELLVQYITMTFVMVLNWWVGRKNGLEAKEADELFQRLVMPTLREAVGAS